MKITLNETTFHLGMFCWAHYSYLWEFLENLAGDTQRIMTLKQRTKEKYKKTKNGTTKQKQRIEKGMEKTKMHCEILIRFPTTTVGEQGNKQSHWVS